MIFVAVLAYDVHINLILLFDLNNGCSNDDLRKYKVCSFIALPETHI